MISFVPHTMKTKVIVLSNRKYSELVVPFYPRYPSSSKCESPRSMTRFDLLSSTESVSCKEYRRNINCISFINVCSKTFCLPSFDDLHVYAVSHCKRKPSKSVISFSKLKSLAFLMNLFDANSLIFSQSVSSLQILFCCDLLF